MPTYFATARFRREFGKLSSSKQALFILAVGKFIEDLRKGRFRKSLRIKRYMGEKDVWELTYAPDGRALFQYGPQKRQGEVHIIWLRIGGHEIFENEVYL